MATHPLAGADCAGTRDPLGTSRRLSDPSRFSHNMHCIQWRQTFWHSYTRLYRKDRCQETHC